MTFSWHSYICDDFTTSLRKTNCDDSTTIANTSYYEFVNQSSTRRKKKNVIRMSQYNRNLVVTISQSCRIIVVFLSLFAIPYAFVSQNSRKSFVPTNALRLFCENSFVTVMFPLLGPHYFRRFLFLLVLTSCMGFCCPLRIISLWGWLQWAHRTCFHIFLGRLGPL